MNSSYAKHGGCGLILVQATNNTQTSITRSLNGVEIISHSIHGRSGSP